MHRALATVALIVTVASCRLVGEGGASPEHPDASSMPATPPSSSIPSVDPDHLQDATAYAEMFGVSIEEALRRSAIQVALDPFIESLRLAAGARWVAGWIEHTPEFRYVVRVTGSGSADLDALVSDWPLPVEFMTGSTHTEAEFLAAMEAIDDRLHELYPRHGMGWEPMRNAIVINGPDELSAEFIAELEALGGVPILYEWSPPGEEH